MQIIKTPTGTIKVDETTKKLTQAEYNALGDNKKDGIYLITDSSKNNIIGLYKDGIQINNFPASKIALTPSGNITKNNVQEAIVENDSHITTTKNNLSSHTNNTSNPHKVTKTQVGLGNVDNTSDANKPVSTAQKNAIDAVNTSLTTHTGNTTVHITAAERTKWNDKSDINSINSKIGTSDISTVGTTITGAISSLATTIGIGNPSSGGTTLIGDISTLKNNLSSHINNTTVHITAAERTEWNSKAAGNHTHNSIKDSNDGNTITITYSKAGQLSTSWLASWNGRELGAISPSKITAGSLNYFQNTSNVNMGQDTSTSNGIGYINDYSGTKLTENVVDGALYRQAYSDRWVHEIYGDYITGQIAVRGKNNGTWQSWRTILDSNNYSSYAATKNHTHNYAGSSSAGGAATNADKVDGFHASQTAGSKSTCVVTDANGYTNLNYINSNTGNNENPTVSQVIVTNGSDNYYRKASLSHVKSALGSMPASDVYSWAKASTKPSYSWSEIGSKPSSFNPSAGSLNYVRVYNSRDVGSNGTVTFNDLAKQHSAVAMIKPATDNPVGKQSWCHCISMAWANNSNINWVSQIALGTEAGTGMWYRTTSGAITGRGWNRVLDSSNYKSYCTPANIGAANSNHTHNYAGSSSAGGAATNADKVDGFHASQTAGSKSTCVVTDANGYTNLNYINSNTGNNENPTVSQVIVTNGSDNYYRKASLSHVKSALGSMPASDVYSWAKASTKPSYSWSEIGSKPSSFNPSAGSLNYVRVYNSRDVGSNGTVTFNDLAKQHSAVAMIKPATDNPVGKQSWCHCISMAWANNSNINWVSQIALGTEAGTGMWYRTTSGAITGRGWNRVLDSSNYKSYCTPANIGAANSNHTHNYAGSSSAGGSANSLNYFQNTSNVNMGQDTSTSNGIGYINDYSGTKLTENVVDGALYRQAYSDRWVHEIYGDYITGQIAVRGKNNGTWQSWRTILDSSNYTSYCTPGKVKQSNITAANDYRILISASANDTEETNQVYKSSKLTFNPYLGSFACGSGTAANGSNSHAEGRNTNAHGCYSHAEGQYTTASNFGSHAEGQYTIACGNSSHAEGSYTIASNYSSHAGGHFSATMTTGGDSNNTTGTAFVIGNGTSTTGLSNAFSIQYDGTVKAKSTITASTAADYAEFFEWKDGNPDNEDRVGKFVTIDGNKILIASDPEDYILGIVSGRPFVLGNGDCDVWTNMHLTDEYNRYIMEPAPKMELDEETGEEKEVLDSEGNPVYYGTRPKLNPDYDPSKPYTSRFDRKEWAPVGMLGVLSVIHDGTCKVNGYAKCNKNGIATACKRTDPGAYRVIAKMSDTVVRVIFR